MLRSVECRRYSGMRQTAEERIVYLNKHDPWVEGGPHETVALVHSFVEERRACQESGDRDAEVEYLEECLKYEPETGRKLRKRI